jgi:hypothetical protein
MMNDEEKTGREEKTISENLGNRPYGDRCFFPTSSLPAF